MPELRIDEAGVGHQPSVDGDILFLDNVGANDAEVVVGNVREGGAAFDVSEGINTRYVGLEPIVCFEEAFGVGFNSGGRQIKRVGIRGAANGDEKVRSCQGSRLRAVV